MVNLQNEIKSENHSYNKKDRELHLINEKNKLVINEIDFMKKHIEEIKHKKEMIKIHHTCDLGCMTQEKQK